MALYCIGDLQGCNTPFERLLAEIDFSPSRDTLYLLGDLVNRGPDSLGVLRRVMAWGDSVQCVLGNHDLHLLAVGYGVRSAGRQDTLEPILQAPDCAALLDWLRHRPMALLRHGWLMVHAGVLPSWTTQQTMALAQEVEQVLRGAQVQDFLRSMYGNQPAQWQDTLQGEDRLRVVVNALTRLRFCSLDGVMDFSSSDSASQAPPGSLPWFALPQRATQNQPIAFGHWSALVNDGAGDLSGISLRHNTLPLDTGCVWGGRLSAAKLSAQAGEFEIISVACAQTLKPGQA